MWTLDRLEDKPRDEESLILAER